MLKSLKDYVFVQIEGTLYNEDTGVAGHNGKSIILDPSYDPQVHVKIRGRVVAIPNKLGKSPINQETKGLPSYTFGSGFKYKRREDIVPEVEVGDMIYFHFNSLLSDGKNIIDAKKNIYKIAYENVLAAVRDYTDEENDDELKEIIMIGGYTMISQDMESWESTLVPTPEVINGEVMVDKYNNPIMKPKEEWLMVKLKPEAVYLSGHVLNVGQPLKGDKTEIENGQKIIYRNNADWPVTIEGQSYLIIRQRHIIASEVEA